MAATAASVTGLYVGSSGFSYPSWRGGFYPESAKPADFLRFYAERLPSVELNNTFYRLPAEDQFVSWGEQTPPGFRFAVKMNRRVTIGGDVSAAPTFCERVRALGDRLGPIRIAIPARPRDEGFLSLLLDYLDPELEYAFEFGHESWAGIDPLLSERGAVRVNALDGDAPFRYLRLREPPYDETALASWAARIRVLLATGTTVYCYFRHEDEPTAPRYAERLRELVAVAEPAEDPAIRGA